MKAIKLASVFAVSAVAAAVSTTTLAAEPTFSGDAGLKYTFGEGATNAYGSEGEVNIKGDNGVIYFDLDMEGDTTGSDGGFDLDEIYVTQGAVQFGDFDGSLADEAIVFGGVDNDDDYGTTLGTDLGVRYSVSDNLTVALEMEEGTNNAALAASYSAPLGPVTILVSGAWADLSDESTGEGTDNYLITSGVSFPVSDALTLEAYTQSGKKEGTSSVTNEDVSSYGIGATLAVSDAVSVSVAHLANGQDAGTDGTTAITDTDITTADVSYTAGDLTYLLSYTLEAEDNKDAGYVKVEASF